MWKIIGSVAAVTLLVLFISFNIDNVSDISFVFFTVERIPVYVTIFISLLIGVLIMLPFALGYRRKKKPASIEHLEQEINTTFDEKFAKENGKKKKKKKRKNDTVPDIDAAPPTEQK